MIAAFASLAIPAGALAGGKQQTGNYKQVNLVSDIPGVAHLTDPNLTNPWGLAAGPKTPLWAADNGTDKATIYPGAVPNTLISIAPLVVDIPGGEPTGEVFNPTDGFVVNDGAGHSGAALFLFASESGHITGWNPNVPPPPTSTSAQNGFTAPDGAVYKGLTLSVSKKGAPRLYATDFHNGKVDMFDSSFSPIDMPGAFSDPNLPAGFAPFGIQAIGNSIVVSYAMQDAAKHDDVAGAGNGFVDVYDSGGVLQKRLISNGELNSPWGLVLTPSGFGQFSHALLVGNFGDGTIHAYDPHTGQLLGQLATKFGPITIDGLWGLRFGNGVTGTPHTLLFSAGLNDEANGLLGEIKVRGHH
ncbi:MAG: TIGR03118 family protein [Thermoleophilaceae bacterium]